jgi:glc operon protein GlcG
LLIVKELRNLLREPTMNRSIALLASLTLTLTQPPPSGAAADKKTLTLDGAKRVLAAAEAAARAGGANGVIAVVDDGGNLIALHRLDGTFPAGANVAIGKARTAAMFRKPTSFFEETIKNGRTAMLAVNDFTPLQGGVPIVVDGQVIGAVGVSGASSAAQDEQVALAGAKAVSDAASDAAPAAMTGDDDKPR